MGDGAGAAGYVTKRPTSEVYNGGWTVSSGTNNAANRTTFVSDDSDTNYIISNNSSDRFDVADYTRLTNQRILRVRGRVRYREVTSTSDLLGLRIYDPAHAAEASSTYVETSFNGTTTFTTYTGAWYTTSPTGAEWVGNDVVLGPVGNFVNNRVAEVYADIDVRDLLTLGTPTLSGTGTSRPTVAWTPTLNADADAQKKYDLYIYPASSYNAAGFSPGVPVASGGKPWAWASGQVASGANSVQVGADLDFGSTYRVYMRLAQDFNGQDWWTGYGNATFTVTIPGGSTPQPPAPTMTRTVDDDRARVVFDLTSFLNLLTANQSSLETDTTGWAAGTATTIARNAGNADHLIASLALTKITSTGTASAITPTGTSGVAVLPSTTYAALASFKAAATARTCKVAVKFYDAAGSYLSGSDLLATGAADNTSTFTAVSVTGTSPATAAFAAVELQVLSAVASEVHYADKISLALGSSTTWYLGGYLTTDTTGLVVEYQEIRGPNYLPANVADAGDSAGNLAGWYERTAGDYLELYGGANVLQGVRSVEWGPSAGASVLDVGMLSTSPTYTTAPLVAPNKPMVASAWVRAKTGTFSVALIAGAHNASGSTGTATGSTTVVGTTWQRITSGVLTPSDGSLYGYVAFDNTADTTTGRLLIDKVQLEVGATPTDWSQGTGDRTAEWTDVRESPLAGPDLPQSGATWMHDYEVSRGRGVRIYRARVEVVEGTSTLSSTSVYAAAYQTPAEGVWWLKDPLMPGLNWPTFWVLDSLAETIAEDVDTVHPLGRDYPVSVSSWISAGSDGSLQFRTSGESDWLALERLLRRQNALLLQSPAGLSKYVRLTSRGADRKGPGAKLQRVVSVSYVEEGAP